jgi:hypothetical protein
MVAWLQSKEKRRAIGSGSFIFFCFVVQRENTGPVSELPLAMTLQVGLALPENNHTVEWKIQLDWDKQEKKRHGRDWRKPQLRPL